ncbi:MAG: hypothetical protein JO212_05445 [Acetobacteraceae bacterium]|nr:hypothetical protein [Acetobacteraceae bacterium]
MRVDFLQEQEGRNVEGRFMKGYSGNPNGRAAGEAKQSEGRGGIARPVLRRIALASSPISR